MKPISRRTILAVAGTLAAGLPARKPRAAEVLPDLASVLKPTAPPVKMPEVVFFDQAGRSHGFGEFRGHGIVVNFWATWCAPCVAELPALEALSRLLAPDNIAVLTLSSDRGGGAAVEKFFQAHAITALPVLLDPKGAAAQAFGARGIPTTVIIDRKGRECARAEGAADWSGPRAAALIRALTG